MKRKIRLSALLTLFAVFSLVSVFAQNNDENIMLIRDIDAEPGDIVTVELEIINDNEMAGFNVDVLIPPGFEVVEDSEELFRKDGHQYVFNTSDGDDFAYDVEGTVVRFMGFSITADPFLGNDGVIFSFDVTTPSEAGIYPIKILGWPEEDYPGYPQPPVIGDPAADPILTDALDGEALLGIRELTITTEGEGGVDVDGDPYTEPLMIPFGTEVDLIATADPGWEFVNWTGDTGGLGDPNEAETTLLMPETDVTLTANFEEIPDPQYQLTVNIVGNGNVDIDPEKDFYDIGDEITLTPVPDEGWEFEGWTGDTQFLDGNVLTMPDDDVELTATFVMS